jgi:hypothetical protein
MSPAKNIRGIKGANLPECEWKFEPFLQDKPAWAVRWCWEWEFARTVFQQNAELADAVSSWRNGLIPTNGLYRSPDCAALALSDEVASELRVVCFASWPKNPFSGITKIEWDQIEIMESQEAASFTPSLCDVDKLPGGDVVLGPEGKSVLVWGDDLTWLTLKIEWEHQSDEQVLSGFKEWLKQARGLIGKPALEDQYNGEMRRLHKELKQLGLYRFRMGYGSHLQAIIDLGKKGIAISEQKLSEAIKGAQVVFVRDFASS